MDDHIHIYVDGVWHDTAYNIDSAISELHYLMGHEGTTPDRIRIDTSDEDASNRCAYEIELLADCYGLGASTLAITTENGDNS
jgi:hypothetical protein